MLQMPIQMLLQRLFILRHKGTLLMRLGIFRITQRHRSHDKPLTAVKELMADEVGFGLEAGEPASLFAGLKGTKVGEGSRGCRPWDPRGGGQSPFMPCLHQTPIGICWDQRWLRHFLLFVDFSFVCLSILLTRGG